ncbi:hypothetical protein D6821_01410, partial [Candidatus Parcubacteria bacterium]
METIKITQWPQVSEEVTQKVVKYLAEKKVIAYPTDTVYGLGCLATEEKPIIKIYKMKNRPIEMPLLILVDSLKMARQYAHISKKQEEYLSKVWPGPVSAVLESRGNLPGVLSYNKQTIAVRL